VEIHGPDYVDERKFPPVWRRPVGVGNQKDVGARITKVDETGRVHVQFSEEMTTLDDCNKYVDKKVLDLEFMVRERRYESETPEYDWSCEVISGDTMILALNTEDPIFVS
jgi:hypothetical protein